MHWCEQLCLDTSFDWKTHILWALRTHSCRSLTRVWSVNFRSSEQCLALRAHLRPRHQKNHTRCTARPRCLVSHRCWLWLLTAVVFSSDHVKPMPRCGIVWLYIDMNTSQGHLCHLIMFFTYFHLVKSLCRSRGRSGFRESCCSGHVTELSTV